MAKIFASLFEPGVEHYKYIDLPLSNYASSSYDKVMKGGKIVGFSMFTGYSYNERSVLSLGVVDPDIEDRQRGHAGVGRRRRRHQEDDGRAHKQIEIRAIVSPVPYSPVAREEYAKGWRTAAVAT